MMANSEPATLVITHKIHTIHRSDYEQWLQRIIPVAQHFEGHMGVNVIRPSGDDETYTVLIRFNSLDNLYHWTQSAERKQLVVDIKPILAGDDVLEVRPGAEFWFTPPQAGVSKPAQWKQFIISIAVIFPSTLVVPLIWGFLFPQLKGTLPGHFLNDATVAGLMVYFWMPMMTRIFARWLKAR